MASVGSRHRWPSLPYRARRAIFVLLAVVALHLGLYALLHSASGPRPQARLASPAFTLRLLPARDPPAAAAAPSRATPTTSAAAAIRARRLPTSGATASAEPQREALAREAAQPPTESASQPPRPLDLTLPQGYARWPKTSNPVVGDPRSQTARATPEQRMATSLGTEVVEESLGDGRRRFRRGDDCVVATASRISQLMPFNDAAARTPQLVSACP